MEIESNNVVLVKKLQQSAPHIRFTSCNSIFFRVRRVFFLDSITRDDKFTSVDRLYVVLGNGSELRDMFGTLVLILKTGGRACFETFVSFVTEDFELCLPFIGLEFKSDFRDFVSFTIRLRIKVSSPAEFMS